jgi:uncharacterized protein (DUF952 family)
LDDRFIHLATEGQIPKVLEKFWGDRDCLILKLQSDQLKGRLVLEANPGGTHKYYHLYDGTIPMTAVIEVF